MAAEVETRRWVIWTLVVYGVLGLVLLLSPVGPGEIIAAIGSWMRGSLGLSWFGTGWIEFIANIVLFIPLGFLLTLLFRRPWLGASLALTLSVAVELAQLLLPGRFASPRDVLANALGAALGALIAWLMFIRRSSRSKGTTRAR